MHTLVPHFHENNLDISVKTEQESQSFFDWLKSFVTNNAGEGHLENFNGQSSNIDFEFSLVPQISISIISEVSDDIVALESSNVFQKFDFRSRYSLHYAPHRGPPSLS